MFASTGVSVISRYAGLNLLQRVVFTGTENSISTNDCLAF